MSAFVYPGVGQFMQRRYAAGVIVGLSFTAAFVYFMGIAFGIMKTYWSLAWENPTETYEAGHALGQILFAFVLCLLIYFAGIVDAHRAQRRLAVSSHS